MTTPIGLIAGRGALPLTIADEAIRSGRGVYVIRLTGFADDALAGLPGEDINLGELGRVISALKTRGCIDIVFAGKVDRPDLGALRFDAIGASASPGLITAAQHGDDALMRALIAVFESEGFNICGPEEIVAERLCPLGVLTRLRPDGAVLQDLAKAFRIAGHIGQVDIGQGCVVCDGLVLAVEAQEGTDQMLGRVAGLPQAIRGSAGGRRGVLVKRAKPVQERRIDLPVIGLQTVRHAAAAGLAGIGLEAGSALVIACSDVLDLADRTGIAIVGLGPDGAPS